MARILHGEEEYEYLKPIYPNDVLTGITTLINGKNRRGSNGSSMDILTLETRYVNQHDQHVLITHHNRRAWLIVSMQEWYNFSSFQKTKFLTVRREPDILPIAIWGTSPLGRRRRRLTKAGKQL